MLKTIYGLAVTLAFFAVGTASAAIDPDRVNVLATVEENATGFIIGVGDSFSIDATNETWGYCGLSKCVTDAKAVNVVDDTVENLTIGINTFGRGGLAGRIGTGDVFFVGESFSGVAQVAGELFLFMWDDSHGDNSGGLQAVLTGFEEAPGDAIPLPAAAWLMAAGLGTLTFRKKRVGRED
ncbi:MAG: hypothetical protein AAFX52_03255 [Pseudomonadota bacterium]